MLSKRAGCMHAGFTKRRAELIACDGQAYMHGVAARVQTCEQGAARWSAPGGTPWETLPPGSSWCGSSMGPAGSAPSRSGPDAASLPPEAFPPPRCCCCAAAGACCSAVVRPSLPSLRSCCCRCCCCFACLRARSTQPCAREDLQRHRCMLSADASPILPDSSSCKDPRPGPWTATIRGFTWRGRSTLVMSGRALRPGSMPQHGMRGGLTGPCASGTR